MRLSRYLIRALGAAAFVLLFVLASRALVRGPEETQAPPAPVPAGIPAALCGTPEAPAPDSYASQPRPPRQESSLLPEGTGAAPAPAEADGNGWIITGRSWARAVYHACPPEGEFG